MKNLFVIILFLVFPLFVFGQSENVMNPLPFFQSFQTLPFSNPAAYFENYKYTVLGGRNGNGGELNGSFTNFFYAASNIQQKSQRHDIGLYFYQDQNGPVFKRSGALVKYSYHFNISKEFEAGAGLTFGMLNYRLTAPSVFNSSDFAFDGSLGVIIKSPKYIAGISVIQFPQARFQPRTTIIRLTRAYQLIFGRNFSVSPNFSVNTLIIGESLENRLNIHGTASVVLQNILLAGFSYNYRRGYTFLAGLQELDLSDLYLTPVFSYTFPYGFFGKVVSPYEITLRVQFKKYD